MGFGVGVRVLSLAFLYRKSQHPDRLISRFFLNLRSIYSHGQPTVGSQLVSAALSPVRTHPYWRRMMRVTTGFTDGLEAETGVYGSFPNRYEGNAPEAATVDLELAVVLQTQQGGDEHSMKPIADLTPPENKLTVSNES